MVQSAPPLGLLPMPTAPESERQGLLQDEESGADAPSASAPQQSVAPRLSPSRLLTAGVAALAVAACLFAAALSSPGRPPAPPRQSVALLSNLALLQGKSEVPSGFDFSKPLSLKWKEDCVEVHVRHFSPAGQGLQTMKCGTRSPQFLLPGAGLEGKISWAGHPEYCVEGTPNGKVHLEKCAKVATANAEFKFVEGGKIQLKARPGECVMVDAHSADSEGRHDLVMAHCDGHGGDALVPPSPEDFVFEIDFPPTTTLATTAAPTTAAPATVAPTVAPATTAAPTTAAPQLKELPSQIILRSTHGKYVVAELGGAVYANRAWADDWEKFEVTQLGEGDIALRSHHKQYVTIDAAGTIAATATTIGPDAHLKFQRNSDGSVSLLTAHGKYVAAEPSGFMIGNRADHSDWEHFEIIDMADTWPNHVAIKSFAGKYFKAYPHGALKAVGNWPLDDWEKFQVTHHEGMEVSLRCDHGEYMKASDADGMIHVSNEPPSATHFVVTHLPDGNFTMESNGKYVWADHDGSVHVDSSHHKSDERAHFQVIFVY